MILGKAQWSRLFRTTAMEFCCGGEKTDLTLNMSRKSESFIAKDRGRGQWGDEKSLDRSIRGGGFSGYLLWQHCWRSHITWGAGWRFSPNWLRILGEISSLERFAQCETRENQDAKQSGSHQVAGQACPSGDSCLGEWMLPGLRKHHRGATSNKA